MNEYNEAISRLEAFERPYNVRYIKRVPFGRYPNHTSTSEYNKILNESRFTRLPKYSIPQRCYINVTDLGSDIYTFDLDKSFVNSLGDRKSIAIRRINFIDENSDKFIETDKFYIKYIFPPNTKLRVANYEFTSTEEISIQVNLIRKISTRSKILALESLQYDIAQLFNKFKDKMVTDGTAKDLITGKPVEEEQIEAMKHECITFHNVDNLECEGEYIKFDIHNYKLETPTPFQIIMGATNLYSTDYVYMFGKNPEITDRGVYCPYTIKYDGKDTFISIGFHDFISCGKAYAICSTLNPYSNQNIIGSLVEHNDTLNKIFPYDGQKQFSIWFNDNEGKRYRNLSIEGYIDLELIIDNTNNLNLDV